MAKKNEELKVLVVEDSKVTMKSLCNYLKRMGIENPLTASTGKAAMEIFRKNRPDIVLLDAILPDIDGFDIAKHFRATERGDDWTAIIFLTSMDKDEDLARGIAAGGDDYLVKPISATVLESKMRAMKRLVMMQRALVDVTQQLNAANKELQRLSMTDGLTGLANRRFFDEMSAREWRRCERVQKPMAVIMLDVDFFKKYNDTYGHQAGDECLKGVAAQVARAAPRGTDLAARYGGEEFVLVLGETTTEGAKQVAANICQYVADLAMPHSASDIGHVSVSCGVASALPVEGMSFEILLKIADEALYKAKQQGRNRVVCAE
jgi:diguanylate cyclase (GGDEF)-like protein